ncbi:MAG: GspH/FimT family protein [Pseudomonadota bacterium]
MKSGSRGFTLAELLVVLVVAGLLLALVPPLVSRNMPSLQVQAAARDLAAGLRMARGEALRSGAAAFLKIDPAENRISVPATGRTRHLPEKVELQITTAQEYIDEDGVAAYHFYPDGSASGGNVVLALRGLAMQVSVDWLTGRIHVAEI